MASLPDSVSMALFCDFENVALGVRDAKYDKFDIKRVLERLLLKGSIVVKKAYCDWDRYKSFKAAMHEASFELIEIPHVRQSGKNSADIRLVVDALDLCYTKSHVDTFVIISGDSDFSPLVSKLRENAKQVIGVGVKQSTSDLLIANCDEFIFYDDLVRDSQRAAAKREARDNPPAVKRSAEEERQRREEMEARRGKAIDIAVETFEALLAERGESGKIWSSMLKEAIKRRKPDFNESYFGFRAFGNLLEEAQARGLLELGRDEKSGTYVTRPGPGMVAIEPDRVRHEAPAAEVSAAAADKHETVVVTATAAEPVAREERPTGRGARRRGAKSAHDEPPVAQAAVAGEGSPPAAPPKAGAQTVAHIDAGDDDHAGPVAVEASGDADTSAAAATRPGRGRSRGRAAAARESAKPSAKDVVEDAVKEAVRDAATEAAGGVATGVATGLSTGGASTAGATKAVAAPAGAPAPGRQVDAVAAGDAGAGGRKKPAQPARKPAGSRSGRAATGETVAAGVQASTADRGQPAEGAAAPAAAASQPAQAGAEAVGEGESAAAPKASSRPRRARKPKVDGGQ